MRFIRNVLDTPRVEYAALAVLSVILIGLFGKYLISPPDAATAGYMFLALLMVVVSLLLLGISIRRMTGQR